MADTFYTTLRTKLHTAWAQTINDFIYKGRNPTFAVTTGSADAYVFTLPSPSLYTSYQLGDFFDCQASFTNTGPATFQVVGATTLAATAITTQGGTALAAGEIVANQVIRLTYNGVSFSLASAIADLSGAITTLTDTITTTLAATLLTPVIQTIWIPAATMFPSIAPLGPPNTFSVERNLVSGGTEANIPQFINAGLAIGDSLQFTLAFPDGWNEGTITFQPYWLIATELAITGTKAKFQLAGVAMSDGESLDDAFGTAIGVEQTVASPVAYRQYIGGVSTALTVAGTPAAGDLCYFKVQRVAAASDDFPGDLTLLGLRLVFTETLSQ